MGLPNDEQWGELIEEIESTVIRLRRDGPTLLSRAQLGGRSGFPSSSRPSPSGSGGISRPVENIVISDMPDRLGFEVQSMVRFLTEAVTFLRRADSCRAKGFPPAPADEGEDGCVVCARVKVWSPVKARQRCGSCLEWARRHGGEDPSGEVVRDREFHPRSSTNRTARVA